MTFKQSLDAVFNEPNTVFWLKYKRVRKHAECLPELVAANRAARWQCECLKHWGDPIV